MADNGHFVKYFPKFVFRIDLKWQKCDRKWISDMQFVKNVQKNKVAYRSEMARNAIESEFRTSKMADGSHFVKISKNIKVAYWSKMARNAIESEFRTSKMADGSHFVKISKINKFAYWRCTQGNLRFVAEYPKYSA